MRIAVFGGTFDPPHNGHIQIAKAAIQAGIAERVLFVPAYKPPHKTQHKISDFKHRLAMLELALNGLGCVEISTMEAKRSNKPSYTCNTMEELSAAHPENEYLLLIGGDSLRQLHTWHRAAELVEKWELAVYPRKSETPSLKEFSKNWNAEESRKLLATTVPLPCLEMSSTDVRQKISCGERVDDLINPAVKCYIDKEKLYKQEKYS